MANIFGAPKAGGPSGLDQTRSVPTGDTIGSYTSYLDAQKAVDYLADQQFPVQMVSIVGNELKMVERVTGRLSYPRVALSGALSGMWFGLFVGVMLSFFSPTGGYFSILTSVLMGAAFFMLFGIVTYAAQRGKRDFTSTSQVVATSYDVIVATEVSHDARRLLQQLPMTPSDAAAQHGAYPQYQNQPYQQPGQQNPPYQQPGQQNPPYQQPGQGPARPSGWADPYGQQPPTQQQPQDQAQQPGYGQQQGQWQPPQGQQPGQQYGQQPGQQPQGGAPDGGAQQQAPAPVRATTYPDLPDGRPQYGVRVQASDPGADQSAQQQAPTRQQGANHADASQPGSTQPGTDQQGSSQPNADQTDADREKEHRQ
ncbi:hypothetical protein PSET11_01895 [Arthrobacter ulcerisalmonis]|uniref:General stress protein 17M-like domain-containing protein n=1 Tax=Arthrobacter ulcerisalmonis TaxID=2483813 RepID=A0A3P5WZ14_9MICC|nr:general stress protein [Arthrobacter ulcerisalmonis]VDC26992.1 hypothetical protein PSET11_01895 [Arthrobacter ulcerisalmonis]